MDVRTATTEDSGAIRALADRSLRSSYSLSPDQIETILEGAFGDEVLADRIDSSRLVVVAEAETDEEDDESQETGGILGFAEANVDGGRTLEWLHVDPDARGRGVGTALIDRVREDRGGEGATFTARVLDSATEGATFLEQFGLSRVDTVEVSFGSEEFHQEVYGPGGEDEPDANEPAVQVPPAVEVDGQRLRVDRTDAVPGTQAPFFPLADVDDERYGFLCSNCGSAGVSADGLDRLECPDCGNVHLPDEYDAAYL